MTLIAVLIVFVLLPALTSKGRPTPLSSLTPESVAQLCVNEVRRLLHARANLASFQSQALWADDRWLLGGSVGGKMYSCMVTGRSAEELTTSISLLP